MMLTARQTPEKTKGAAPDQENAPFATNRANSNADRAAERAFCTLRAQFAVLGHCLYRIVSGDGTILYLAGKWGYCRELKSLEAAAIFLKLIGGRA